MTIDEAIEREETRIKYMGVFLPCDGCMINDCKEYRRQLAEWLRELKAYRGLIANADKLIESEYGVVIIEGYADVLSQMKEIYEEVKADD